MTIAERRLLIIDGHPDPDRARLTHALAHAYVEGAHEAGLLTRMITLADIEFSVLRTPADFDQAPQTPSILSARADVEWATHIVIIFPIWLGSAPAYLRAFLEQVARADFLATVSARGWSMKLKGKSARLIATMGMPAIMYRLMFGAFGVRSIARSVLGFAGVGPVRITLFGGGGGENNSAARWLRKARELGVNGA